MPSQLRTSTTSNHFANTVANKQNRETELEIYTNIFQQLHLDDICARNALSLRSLYPWLTREVSNTETTKRNIKTYNINIELNIRGKAQLACSGSGG